MLSRSVRVVAVALVALTAGLLPVAGVSAADQQPSELTITGPTSPHDACPGQITWQATLKVAGAPAADQPVTTQVTDPRTGVHPVDHLTTDADGHVQVPYTPDEGTGAYTFDVEYAGTDTTLPASASTDLDVVPCPTVVHPDGDALEGQAGQPLTFSGTVTDAHGADLDPDRLRVPTVYIYRYTPSGAGGFVGSTDPSADGSWSWTDQHPRKGTWDYRVQFFDYAEYYAGSEAHVAVTIDPVDTLMSVSAPDQVLAGETAPVTVTVTDLSGSPVTTGTVFWGLAKFPIGSDGTVTLSLTFPDAGPVTLDLRYDDLQTYGQSTATVPLEVLAKAGQLSVRPAARNVTLGDAVELVGSLTADDGSQVKSPFKVYRRRGGEAEVLLGHYWAPSSDGSFTIEDTPTQLGVYTYRLVLPRSPIGRREVKTKVTVGGLALSSTPRRPLSFDGPYAVYDATKDPTIRTTTHPVRSGICLRYQAQRRADGTWKQVSTSRCHTTDAFGNTQLTFTHRHPAGTKWRIRPVFAGDTHSLPTKGRWVRLRFS